MIGQSFVVIATESARSRFLYFWQDVTTPNRNVKCSSWPPELLLSYGYIVPRILDIAYLVFSSNKA